MSVAWLAPESLDEALELRADRGADATVLAGGTFLGILMNQGFLAPKRCCRLGRVPGLDRIEVVDGELRLGAMVSHRAVERSRARAERLARAGPRLLARGQPARAQPGHRGRGDGRRRLRVRSARGARRARRAGGAALADAATRAVSDGRADPRLLRDLHRRGRAAGVEVRVPPGAGARCVPEVPLALQRGPALRGGGRGARRSPACAWWWGRWPTARRSCPTCARWPTAAWPTTSWPARSVAVTRRDRADERLARQRRLPAPGDRAPRCGAPWRRSRERSARAGRSATRRTWSCPGHVARRLRALPAGARPGALASTPRACPADLSRCSPRTPRVSGATAAS